MYQITQHLAPDSFHRYLRAVGMERDYTVVAHPCDLCGDSSFRSLVTEVDIGRGQRWELPVVMCNSCGFVMQNPRFESRFYEDYYRKYYRVNLFGATEPERAFVLDQMRRGDLLYRAIEQFLPDTGALLDVGCSAGGMMVPFHKRGWQTHGTDPDFGYADYGRRQLKLAIDVVSAEEMVLPDEQFDLIVITGSLEHVYDVNRTLEICRRASRSNGLLFIEGRALESGAASGVFSHTHRRYLTLHSIRLLMRKHGWTPMLATSDPLCGPTRPGGVYVLGRVDAPLTPSALLADARRGARDEQARVSALVAPEVVSASGGQP
ncbi:class I SAM-dependent methyltransferase [Paraherbaspirillum soli]|uniref:Class I SAM-dependent methyltransferase n=1 Tax=Paraherbaspirillum soli TaxID=631222 RepID=A0ABW0MC35_9BURK